jgi:hypothetical protein
MDCQQVLAIAERCQEKSNDCKQVLAISGRCQENGISVNRYRLLLSGVKRKGNYCKQVLAIAE